MQGRFSSAIVVVLALAAIGRIGCRASAGTPSETCVSDGMKEREDRSILALSDEENRAWETKN